MQSAADLGGQEGLSAESLPIVVIGAGPVGLAAAAQLLERGLQPLVLEAGQWVGESVRRWGHVRLFSPWRYVVNESARRMLLPSGWREPARDEYPTGTELVDDYLAPLASLPEMAATIRLEQRVTAVTRQGFDRMKSAGRDEAPFLVSTLGPNGEASLLARAVIDASGTLNAPNPLGAGGVFALGEKGLRHRIRYGIPDVLGSERDRYTAVSTLVVGSGHSATGAVLDLAELSAETGGSVLWALRREEPRSNGGEDDGLPRRAALGQRAQALLEAGAIEAFGGFRVAELRERDGRVQVISEDGRALLVDEVIAATGFRPELDGLRELRLELDPITEAPVRLAPLIDPNVHSCGTVPPHGEAELSHPERGFYTAGMKSYGRAPTFLLLTGYEQVRSIAAFLAGDHEGARNVELTLPETGVCSGGGCCSNEPATSDAAGVPEPVVVGQGCSIGGLARPGEGPAVEQGAERHGVERHGVNGSGNEGPGSGGPNFEGPDVEGLAQLPVLGEGSGRH